MKGFPSSSWETLQLPTTHNGSQILLLVVVREAPAPPTSPGTAEGQHSWPWINCYEPVRGRKCLFLNQGLSKTVLETELWCFYFILFFLVLATELKSLVHTKHAFLKPNEVLSLVAHSYIPSTREAEAGRLRGGG
jgi:hypothetical protein